MTADRMLREALRRARLMISGRYRIPWSVGADTTQKLLSRGLITDGGYLTDAGLRLNQEDRHDR